MYINSSFHVYKFILLCILNYLLMYIKLSSHVFLNYPLMYIKLSSHVFLNYLLMYF